jgi:hypothetical protein
MSLIRFPLRTATIALAAVSALALNGCAWTLISAAAATGSVVQAGFTVASQHSSPTFLNGNPADIRSVCIEMNQNVTIGDFLPALQMALSRRGVSSVVYNPGASPPGCEAQMLYNAAVDYGRPEFSDESRQYLSAVDLTLLQRGQIVVTARYETQGLAIDKFASVSSKLNGLIPHMVVDQHNLASHPMQVSGTN